MTLEIGDTKQNFDFSLFKVTKVLSCNAQRKTIFLLGHFENLDNDKQAIVILEKGAFEESILEKIFNDRTKWSSNFLNDIYSNLECYPDPEINSIKTKVIYPATEKHIQKYTIQSYYLFKETPEFYNNIIYPYFEKNAFTLDWVYNILDHKSEVDRIAFEDPCDVNGFILLPDLKWDGKNVETLHFIAIVRNREIRSIRDLRGEHLILLKNIRNKSCETILEKYNLTDQRLRMYFHYHPSFNHLHVHLTYLKFEAPGIYCERSHLLDNVINNIELLPDYYEKATLHFTVSESHELFDLMNQTSIKKQKLN